MITITRINSSPQGTIGRMTDNSGSFLCYTLELPWADNHPQISCIPDGKYHCIPHNSPAHPDTWQVTNVPDRSEILIHTGNTVKDSLGCILVGDRLGAFGDFPAVLDSIKTLSYLKAVLPSEFDLIITGAA